MKTERFWRATALFGVAFLLLNVWVAWSRQGLVEERRRNLLQEKADRFPRGRAEQRPGETFESHWERIPDAASHRLVFVSGMSQMYAINDRQPHDRIIADILDAWLEPRGARAVSLAGPNLNNEEALLFFLAGLSDPSRRPAVFVYGVCFDKFRNTDLRREYLEFLDRRPSLRRLWMVEAENANAYPLAAAKMRDTGLRLERASTEAAKEVNHSLEARLRKAGSKVLPVVAAREELNARLQLDLFMFRNWVLRIDPSSKRPIIGSRYELNQQFLELLVSLAKRERITLVLYVIPLNPMAQNPYISSEYQGFKAWVSNLAAKEGLPFANLEGIVPSEHWGEFLGGPDFKHFRGEGHRMTASALIECFGRKMAGGAIPGS